MIKPIVAALFVAASLATAANAAIVTTPSGILNGTPSPGASDTFAFDTWLRQNVRTGASTGITNTFPYGGDGSAWLTSADGTGKADWSYFRSGGFGKLSDVVGASYVWYRASSSTNPAIQMPAFRIVVDIDGDLVTTPTDIAYLVYEQAYNEAGGWTAPTDAWQASSIVGSTYLWVSQPGVGNEEVFNRTLADYQAGTYTPTPGWSQITGNSVVLGIMMGIGSGWAGAFTGAVDNATLVMGGAAPLTFASNFEVTAPAPRAPAAPVPVDAPLPLAAAAAALALLGWRKLRRAPR